MKSRRQSSMNNYYEVQGNLKAEIKNLEWLSKSLGIALSTKDNEQIKGITELVEQSNIKIDKKLSKLALIATNNPYNR